MPQVMLPQLGWERLVLNSSVQPAKSQLRAAESTRCKPKSRSSMTVIILTKVINSVDELPHHNIRHWSLKIIYLSTSYTSGEASHQKIPQFTFILFACFRYSAVDLILGHRQKQSGVSKGLYRVITVQIHRYKLGTWTRLGCALVQKVRLSLWLFFLVFEQRWCQQFKAASVIK